MIRYSLSVTKKLFLMLVKFCFGILEIERINLLMDILGKVYAINLICPLHSFLETELLFGPKGISQSTYTSQNTIKSLDVLSTRLNSKSLFTLPPTCCVENSHSSHLKHYLGDGLYLWQTAFFKFVTARLIGAAGTVAESSLNQVEWSENYYVLQRLWLCNFTPLVTWQVQPTQKLHVQTNCLLDSGQ
jgi:hypothetical protein